MRTGQHWNAQKNMPELDARTEQLNTPPTPPHASGIYSGVQTTCLADQARALQEQSIVARGIKNKRTRLCSCPPRLASPEFPQE